MPDSLPPATRVLATPGSEDWDAPAAPTADELRDEAGEPRSFARGPAVVTDEDLTAFYRRRRLLLRLDGLAEDALLEGCENAAQVLREAADSLRMAVLRDAWDRYDPQAAAGATGPRPHRADGHACLRATGRAERSST